MVIFDEAHNLFNTLTDIYSPRISLLMFETSLNQLSAYYMRYSDRLSSSSHSFIIHLQTVLKEFISFLQSRPSDLGVVSVLSTDGLLRRLHLEDVNLFDLLRFVVAKRILFKLNGFIDREGGNRGDSLGGFGYGATAQSGTGYGATARSSTGCGASSQSGTGCGASTQSNACHGSLQLDSNDPPTTLPPTSYFPAVLDFIGALTTDNNDSRIVVSYEEKQAYVQLLLLNPADHFQEIASLCRSVIITGGTLQPVCYESELNSSLANSRCNSSQRNPKSGLPVYRFPTSCPQRIFLG